MDRYVELDGRKLKLFRKQKSLTQYQLQDLTGIAQPQISEFERKATSKVEWKTLAKLASALKTPAETLIAENGHETPSQRPVWRSLRPGPGAWQPLGAEKKVAGNVNYIAVHIEAPAPCDDCGSSSAELVLRVEGDDVQMSWKCDTCRKAVV